MSDACASDPRIDHGLFVLSGCSPITHYPLPITHYPSPITHHPSPITHHPLPITHHPLPITHHPLPLNRIPPHLRLIHRDAQPRSCGHAEMAVDEADRR